MRLLPVYLPILLLLGLNAAAVSGVVEAQSSVAPPELFIYQGIDEAACADPANPVVAENCLPGTAEWVTTDYELGLEVFTSTDSVHTGETIDFFVQSSDEYNLYIYRLGYYGGLGAREVYQRLGLPVAQQPACARAEDTGLRTCSNWSPAYSLPIPNDWVSGIYHVRVEHVDGGEHDTVFVVRQDDRESDMLFQQSMTTYQAYNNFGGKSTYNDNSSTCPTLAEARRAVKVSLNRPYIQTIIDPNYFFRTEYPVVRWLEQNGYDVTYSTNMDTHRSGKPGATNELLDHKVFLSVGHDEYWSQEMRDAITAARDAGVHLAFLSANTAFWRVRFEPDPLTREPDSVMVVYKTSESGPPDPSGFPTTTFRDKQGVNQPENELLGIMYIGDNNEFYFPLRVSAEQGKDPLYRHTPLGDLPAGTFVDVGDDIVGWEWDARVDNGFTPEGLTVVATTPVVGVLVADNGSPDRGNVGFASADTSYYIAPSGAKVFSSGTIQWGWGLGAQGLTLVPADPIITQVTYNLFSDMDVQPASPDPVLILDGSDRTPVPLPEGAIKRPSDIRTPVVTDLEVEAGMEQVTVRWKTDIATTSQLLFGFLPGMVNAEWISEHDYVTEHEIVVGDLEPSTVYYFRMAGVSQDGGLLLADEGKLETNSLPFPNNLIHSLRQPAVRVGCWARANTSGIVLLGIIGLVLVSLVVVYFVTVRRANKNAKTQSGMRA